MDMGLMLMLKSVSEKGGEHKHAGDVENPFKFYERVTKGSIKAHAYGCSTMDIALKSRDMDKLRQI